MSRRSKEEIAEALLALRKQAGLSQEELAKRAGLKQGRVNMMEQGASGHMLEACLAICDALGASILDVTGDLPPEAAQLPPTISPLDGLPATERKALEVLAARLRKIRNH